MSDFFRVIVFKLVLYIIFKHFKDGVDPIYAHNSDKIIAYRWSFSEELLEKIDFKNRI